jgi:F-box domain
MNTLPIEITKYIFTHLPVIDLVILMYVNKTLNNYVIDILFTRKSLQYIHLSHEAAKLGYLNILKWLEERNNIIDAHTLTNAIKYNHIDVAKWLLLQNHYDGTYMIYLNTAVSYGNFDMMQWICENGDSFSLYPYGAFKKKLKKYDYKTIDLLFKFYEKNKLYETSVHQNILFTRALVYGYIEYIIKMQVHIHDNDRRYHYCNIIPAIRSNRLDDLKIALELNPTKNGEIEYTYDIIHVLNDDNIECLKLLLENDYYFYLSHDFLRELIHRNCIKVIELLKVSKNYITSSIMYYAVKGNHIDIVSLFYKLNPESINRNITYVICNGFLEILELCKEKWSDNYESFIHMSYDDVYHITQWIKINKPYSRKKVRYFEYYMDEIKNDIIKHNTKFTNYTRYD